MILKSKKIALRTAGCLLVALLVASTSWYIFFVTIPKSITKDIVGEFEIAVRDYDRKYIEKIVSENSRLLKLEHGIYPEYFSKFYEGIEVTGCMRRTEYLWPSDKDIIWAKGRMKAKIDDKYRNNFEFSLVKDHGVWKLEQFHFPDFEDYW